MATPERLDALLRLRGQEVLAQIATDTSLSETLEKLLRAVEDMSQGGMMTSILLLDESGKRLLHGAAPSLPPSYNAAIHGIEIGPGVGSCGTAVYLGHSVYVTDIESDPLWKDFRGLAQEHGLRACWSTPIIGSDSKVLGTFAIYYPTPRSPTPREIESIKLISQTTAAAIERHRASSPALSPVIPM